MSVWRALAETALETLLPVATTKPNGIMLALVAAHANLAAWTQMARLGSMGHAVGAADFRAPPNQRSVAADIEAARRGLSDLCGDHAQAGRVIDLCRTRLGLAQDDPLWPALEEHRAAAVHHAARAREALHSAASNVMAAVPVIGVATQCPAGSPAYTAWYSALLDLTRRASWATVTAMHAVARMSGAVAWEWLYVFKVLNRRDLPVRCTTQALQASRSRR